MTDKTYQGISPAGAAQMRGFSMIELVVVLGIIVVMIGICVPSVISSQRAYASDDAAAQVLDSMRFAYQKSLTERQIMRVRIDTTAGTVQVIDEAGTVTTADDKVIRTESLSPQNKVTIAKPASAPTPPAPYNFTAAPTGTGPWEIRFRGDGVAVNAAGTPQSATIYFYVPTATGTASFVSAITIFGPGVSIKAWTLIGGAFVQR